MYVASLERLRTCPGLVSFVGVGALCPAFIVSGGVGCLVVRVVVFGLRCGALWGVSRGFCAWVYVYMSLPFPGLVAAFSGLVGTPPEGD